MNTKTNLYSDFKTGKIQIQYYQDSGQLIWHLAQKPRMPSYLGS